MAPKGKFEYWRTTDGLLRLNAYARSGLTDEQIATNMQISTGTLYEWKKRFAEISEALKRGKEIVDIEVENALLKRALGYTYNEDEYISVPMNPQEYDEKLTQYLNMYKFEHPEATDSELMLVREQFPTTKTRLVKRRTREVSPDTTAQIFWLKNRNPEAWREKQQVELSGTVNNPFKELSKEQLLKLAGGKDDS